MGRLVAFLLGPMSLAFLVLSVARVPAGAQAQTQPVAVTVDLFEWGVQPNVATVPAGMPVRFTARNTGAVSHQLAVSSPGAQGAVLAPGESSSFEVTFASPGTVQLLCPIGNVPLLPGSSHRQRGMETALTVEVPPQGVTVQATPSIAPAPQIAALTAPGASEDRVTLPEDYRQRFGTFYVFDRSDNRQVRHVFGNAQALSARAGQPFPHGSILVMETWRAKIVDNQIALDATGRYQKDELAGVFVMRKELGFGAKYGPDQTGEWEYVAYRPDGGGFQTAPERSQACAMCHLVTSDGHKDWVVRAGIFFSNPQRVLPGILALPRTGGRGAPFGLPPGAAPIALAMAAPLVALGIAAARSGTPPYSVYGNPDSASARAAGNAIRSGGSPGRTIR